MQETALLESLGWIVIAGAVCVLLLRALRVPSIVAYLAAGLLLGPVTGLVTVTDTIELIAEVGIALLLFLVGLELSLDKIRNLGKVAVVAGLGQVVFTAVGGFLLSLLLGFTAMEAIFLGTALTFSSTVVVVKLLDQKKEIDTLYGRIAVGIFLVQDLVVVVALTFLAGLGREAGAGWASLAGGVGLAFLGMAGLLLLALLASRHVLPGLFGWAAGSSQVLFIWSLCWCFLFVLIAEKLQLSLEIGAFLAGISLAQLPYNEDLRRRVHPLMNFFIAVFFVTLGVQMELGAALAQWQAAVVLSLFVLIGNPFIFMWIIAALGYSERTSFLTSVTVAQISEFSFIFAAMGLAVGLIDEAVLSVVAFVGLVTIVASAFMILYNHPLYAWVRRLGLLRPFRAVAEDPEVGEEEEPLTGHLIVVGMNALGRRLVDELCRRGERVLAVDTDPNKLAGLPCRTVMGNAESAALLEEARLADAKLLISTLHIEDTNNFLAFASRQLGVPTAIHVFDESVEDELAEIGVDHLMLSKHSGLRRILRRLEEKGIVHA